MDGHDPYGVEAGVLFVLPTLGVGVLGAVLEETRERAVLLDWLGLVVDRLVVGNDLAEPAEVVQDDLATLVRDPFLPDASLLEKGQEHALDRVLSPPLLIGVGECGLRGDRPRDRLLECHRIDAEAGGFPGGLQGGRVDTGSVGDEVEELPSRFRLRGPE